MANISENSLLVRGARIIEPDRAIERGALLIDGGRIAHVFGSSDDFPSADSEFDLAGLTLFPGFIDVHIHGAVGVDTMTANAADLRRCAEYLASKGVTGWLPSLVPGTQEQYGNEIRVIDSIIPQQTSAESQDGSLQARVLGVHYEGPFVNKAQCGALHPERFRTFASAADLDALPTLKSERAVHLTTVAPEIEGGIELIKELRRRGWVVSIGHTRATLEVLDQAFAAGAHHMTHFMNAMPSLHHRSLGPVGWGLLRDDVTFDMIADGIHLDPMMLKLILRSKSAERICLISDSLAAAGLGDGDYEVWGEKISVRDGHSRNACGGIASSVITMVDAVRMMLSLGASEIEVARMASTNPARLLGIDHDCGSIEEEKRADLVALDQAGNVRYTIIGGQVSEARP